MALKISKNKYIDFWNEKNLLHCILFHSTLFASFFEIRRLEYIQQVLFWKQHNSVLTLHN